MTVKVYTVRLDNKGQALMDAFAEHFGASQSEVVLDALVIMAKRHITDLLSKQVESGIPLTPEENIWVDKLRTAERMVGK